MEIFDFLWEEVDGNIILVMCLFLMLFYIFLFSLVEVIVVFMSDPKQDKKRSVIILLLTILIGIRCIIKDVDKTHFVDTEILIYLLIMSICFYLYLKFNIEFSKENKYIVNCENTKVLINSDNDDINTSCVKIDGIDCKVEKIDAISEIIIPEGVKKLGYDAFIDCASLRLSLIHI